MSRQPQESHTHNAHPSVSVTGAPGHIRPSTLSTARLAAVNQREQPCSVLKHDAPIGTAELISLHVASSVPVRSDAAKGDPWPDADAKVGAYSHKPNRDKVRRELCVEVTNLSGSELSEDELSLLSKGLGFIPARGVPTTQVMAELREWERLMRLREFWHNNSGGERDRREAIDDQLKKSNWTPPKGRDPSLDLYIEEVTKDILASLSSRRERNLSRGEEEALKRLPDDDKIVIRPADKGSGIVFLNSEDYWHRLQEEVGDSSTYRQTEGEQTKAVSKKVKALADRLLSKGYIGRHHHKYLTPTMPRAGYLQGNPKTSQGGRATEGHSQREGACH